MAPVLPPSAGALLRRAAGPAIASMFEGLAAVGALHPKARPDVHGIERLRDIPYRESGLEAHLLDIYRPIDCDDAPVLFYVHGGGFRILSKDTHWVMGLAFARAGFVVVNINYRLAPAHPFPAALVDASRALGWVQDHIGEYGGDPDRLVIAGESAGANLACALTLATSLRAEPGWLQELFDREVRPTATIAACGMLQVSDPDRFRRRKKLPGWLYDRIEEVSNAYLGASSYAQRRSERWANPLILIESLAGPEAFARPLPPFFTPVGTRDPILDDTRRLAKALRRLETPVVDRYYPGEVHAFHAFVWREQARRCWEDTFAFLQQHGPAMDSGG
ncbi:alpha/beta hydrolase [Lujinxingia vulgaris]|uniref:Alpha/beta hydrolase n=1 Tax=Lujinxingia vulgaris TaxID=2600176 RepID=A0A5C6XIA2_9DELT|nr:alpha/beta hydrolase [Lujinxingia vulgaris]TXD37862.1 alpha/beta hydrolase [Lujinxingia vulgaris]